ncbi:PAS domain-containing protein [Bradyrhizobium sp. CB82]|uniref:PAS domain-containing protein n=1 Tax=Bradyrhizobium sp. CB82 TaxID=3039159 RepID=UPI0024B1D758|nr:PAS domain-containing protein [Bradyrhizobium sp. CB82]WFU41967.1 PAS domain-containing protein [Bradyrhizobium sp. CB82]
MNSSDFQLRGVGDPRLAVHATSPLPAWLWSIDGARVVWANPVGAKLFGAANATELARKSFGPADPHRRQVAQLGRRLRVRGAVRLERLHGFGASLGTLMTCACARLEFPDGSHGVLVNAMSTSGRVMPLVERLRRLVEGAAVPMAAFASDGLFIGASETARVLLGFPDLTAAGLDQARSAALAQGRAKTPLGIGHMVLQRVGVGADTGLVALFEPGATQGPLAPRYVGPEAAPEAPGVEPVQSKPPATPLPDYEQPALTNEAPAEFALFDAFAELETPTPEAASSKQAVDNPDKDIVSPKAAPISAAMDQPPPAADPPATPRNQPMRFLWQMDAVGRFVLGSDDFVRLMGAHTAAGFGRLWSEIAEEFALDPEGRVAKALATRDTWAGITVKWPVDGGERLPVELAGIPIYDRMRNFAGFKGFGVCRDLDGLNRLDALRRFELFTDPPAPQRFSADTIEPVTEPEREPPVVPDIPEPIAELPEPIIDANSQQADLDHQVETPPNVVPFRPLGDTKSPTLTPVENSAFNELARQLSERLERERDAAAASVEPQETTQAIAEEPSASPAEAAPRALAEWLTEPEPTPRGEPLRDRPLLDLVPSGILIYRLDRLLYANPAFLARVGHGSLDALEEAGGLDALYVAPGVSSESSTSEAGTPVTISATDGSDATEARLHTIAWDGDTAHALICTLPPAAPAIAEALTTPQEFEQEPEPEFEEEPEFEAGQANAEDLAAILDTTAEGIIMFDAEGNIHACNRSAEALFGYDGEALLQQNLATLFAPESQRVVIDYLDSIRGGNIASLLDHGREVLGRECKGGVIPLAMIMGRTQPDGPNFFAVFRDLSQSKKGESELKQAQRLADGAANAKADMLARISHEIRTPLNAIIGFAEVMISERFGALGNERYGDYMKDIRASGERVIAIIDDLSELSRIETGKLDLTFGNLNLNDLVEACVAVMQPQANRERIIIRTSLAHALPQISADARALRQVTMNLIGNSIRLASAGGQVIVSTALTDRGEVALRIRDTGHGLSEKEVAAAMEPFRTPPPPDASESAGLSLSLTRALVEANRARFNIKSAANTGTLIEVVFAPSLARA